MLSNLEVKKHYQCDLFESNKLIELFNVHRCSSFHYIHDNTPTGFHNLPVKILVNIFKNLNEIEIRKYVIPVCHKWKHVALFPELWKKITFRGMQIPNYVIYQQLQMFCFLQEIYLFDVPYVASILRRICRYNLDIKKIVIKNCSRHEKVPERILRNLVACCRKIEDMNLKGTPFNGAAFFIEVAVLPNLKKLNIGNNPYLTTKNIFELILNNSKLEELKISNRGTNQQLSDNDSVFLFSNLRETIKSFTFDMAGLTDVSYTALFECEKIEKLYLYNAAGIQPETFTNLWKKLPNLKFLKIHNCQLEPEHFIELFTEGYFVLNNLVLLNLTGCLKLNAEGLTAIAKTCKNLKKAVFKCCKNLENIEILLKNCGKLEILNIAFCHKVSDENLLAVPEELKNLNILYTDRSRKLLFDDIKFINPYLNIYICQSEFNKMIKKIL